MRLIRIACQLALLCVLALTTGVAPAGAEGPPCGLHPGACFMPIDAGEPFFLYDELSDDDADGDVDYILYFTDGFNDFWKQLPNGKLFAHANEQGTGMIYCPFYPFDEDWNFIMPDDTCVFGEGNVSVNGFYDEALFLCPATVQMHGSGWRASDGEYFEFRGRWITVGNGRGPGCDPGDQIQFTIEDTMP